MQITWITSQGGDGTNAIVAEASSETAVRRFVQHAADRGRIVNYVARGFGDDWGYHWDGSRLSAEEIRRIRCGITRNS